MNIGLSSFFIDTTLFTMAAGFQLIDPIIYPVIVQKHLVFVHLLLTLQAHLWSLVMTTPAGPVGVCSLSQLLCVGGFQGFFRLSKTSVLNQMQDVIFTQKMHKMLELWSNISFCLNMFHHVVLGVACHLTSKTSTLRENHSHFSYWLFPAFPAAEADLWGC